jgi:diacylglycerol kinase family enzyme
MYKFVFLINPISGGGQGKVIYKFLPEIMESMNHADSEWKAEFTDKDRMEEQTREALASTETLIAVGGDGTVSAVLSTMLLSGFANKVKIGLIPLGTGNDLARVLHLYKPFVDRGLLFLVRRLLLARARPFDLWQVNGKLAMANYFSGGIDARIAHDFNQDRATGVIASNSVFLNKLHYVRRFFADRSYHLKKTKLHYVNERGVAGEIDISGNRTVIIGNIPSYASGSNPFLDSDMADGLLDLVIVPNMFNFLSSIAIGTVPVIGYLFKRFFLQSVKVQSIRIDLDPQEFLQLDGEDLSGKLGDSVVIKYAHQVQMLTLGG